MDLPTHFAFGLAVGFVFFGHQPELALVIGLGALLPDLDREYWFIPQKKYIEEQRHRALFHNVIVMAATSMVFDGIRARFRVSLPKLVATGGPARVHKVTIELNNTGTAAETPVQWSFRVSRCFKFNPRIPVLLSSYQERPYDRHFLPLPRPSFRA